MSIPDEKTRDAVGMLLVNSGVHNLNKQERRELLIMLRRLSRRLERARQRANP